MGCDIHCHVEIKIDGKWEHYNMPRVGRNYRLFALLADVRNYDGIEPISPVKGIPGDLSLLTRLDAEYWGTDGHSHSWLSVEEMKRLDLRKEEALHPGMTWNAHGIEGVFGYLDGNSWGGFVDYPEDRRKYAEDYRLVFWFDN